jgi:hypothetical protein
LVVCKPYLRPGTLRSIQVPSSGRCVAGSMVDPSHWKSIERNVDIVKGAACVCR